MDHGFLYGDSVYETVRTYRRVPFLLSRHLDRLQRSLDRVFLPLPLSRKELEAEVLRTVREVPIAGDLVLRIVVSRGIGAIGLDVNLCEEPCYLIYALELANAVPPQADPDSDGSAVRVVISKVRRNSPRALDPSIKSGNFLNNILAFKEACDASAYEALLCTSDGYLAEGTTANVFVAKDGFVWTPRSWGILDGITRAVVFEEAEAAGIQIGETNIPPEALFSADEIFLSSSVKGIVPVGSVNDRPIGKDGLGGVGRRGPLTLELQRRYRARMERECAELANDCAAGGAGTSASAESAQPPAKATRRARPRAGSRTA
jgi:branched-chain amino acid aminotransferase